MNDNLTKKQREWIKNLDYKNIHIMPNTTFHFHNIGSIGIWFYRECSYLESPYFYKCEPIEMRLEQALDFQKDLNKAIELMKEYESLEDNT